MKLPSATAPLDRRTFLAVAAAPAIFAPERAAAALPRRRSPAGTGRLSLAEVLASARELLTTHVLTTPPNDEAWVHGAGALFAQLAELPPDPFGALTPAEETFLRQHTWTFRRVDSAPQDRVRPAVITHQIHVAPNGRIPLHDHRELFGAIVVAAGEIEIRSFDIAAGDTTTDVVTLRETNRAWLVPGRFALLTRSRDNVHEFRAGPAGARLLDLFAWLGDDSRSHDLTWIDDPASARADRCYRARWA